MIEIEEVKEVTGLWLGRGLVCIDGGLGGVEKWEGDFKQK